MKTPHIIRAMDEKNLNVQTITKLINKYKGINTTTSEVRAFIREPKGHLERYIRLVLDIEPDSSFNPPLKPYDAQNDYKRRIDAMANQEAYSENNAPFISAFIRALGGYEIVEAVCGLKPAGARGWLQHVNDDGVRGYIPEPHKPILRDYVRRIKLPMTPEFNHILKEDSKKPKVKKKGPVKSSEYRGVTKVNGKYQARISMGKRNIYIDTFDTEEEAALAFNKYAKRLGRPLNEVPCDN